MGKPVVSTTVGAEGLPITNNEELVLADSASDFATALIRVFHDRDWAAELGGRAAKLVREKFGWRGVAESFAALCAETANSPQKGTKSTQKQPVS
jgi:glycosyltransferase involved in cell wall biosynthesis